MMATLRLIAFSAFFCTEYQLSQPVLDATSFMRPQTSLNAYPNFPLIQVLQTASNTKTPQQQQPDLAEDATRAARPHAPLRADHVLAQAEINERDVNSKRGVDSSKASNPKTADQQKESASQKSPFDEAMDIAEKKMRMDLHAKIERISLAKSLLKKAMVTDDAKVIAKQTEEISECQKDLRKLLDGPLPLLDPTRFEKGQVGVLSPHHVAIIDMNNEEVVGFIFDHSPSVGSGGNAVGAVKLVGMQIDKARRSKRLEFDPTTNFIVVGPMVHEYESGGIKMKARGMELHVCQKFRLTADEKKMAQAAADPKYTIVLTDAEEATAKAAREKNLIVAKEKERLANDEKSKKESETKARRSQSYLESGKLLLKKDNFSGARKQFEKAIAESPDSDSAKEAAKLIEKLP